ncbi:MAG: alpha/beta hydrolase-fold protein [Myxococcaceae bacterium]|nr:alpha/beta hydrolase-fold protein [Myxococcaceae bacterium]
MSRLFVAPLLVIACSSPPEPSQPPAPLRTTYRVISGASMGGIGSTSLGLTHPDRFDAIAPLGGPLDYAFFSRSMDRFFTGGFCTKAEIEAVLARDPVALNDPRAFEGCSKRPPTLPFEHSQDFNHWHVTINGGTFDRNSYGEMFTDLSLAYGNFFSENPASPVAPPGVDPERIRRFPADFCTNPTRVKRLFNAEYNPDGAYDAITFCDGEPNTWTCRGTKERVDFCSDPANIATPLPRSGEQAFAERFCASKGGALLATKSTREGTLAFLDHGGFRDPCRQATEPQGVILAIDFNGNGRRDFGEPIVNNGRERFDDVGADGCPNALEDGQGGCGQTPVPGQGDLNRDDYDVETNPAGTEQNWVWDEGEPFRDLGLDGVAGTGDVGEGNAAFDESTGRKTLKAYDGRTNYRKLDANGRRRFHVLADGGLRDIFNLGLMAKHLFSAVKTALGPDAVGDYRDFTEIPGMKSRSGAFDPWTRRWAQVPRNLLTLYGKPEPTDDDRIAGEGDHVGTNEQALFRFATVFNWVGSLWPSLEKPPVPAMLNGVQKSEWFVSKQLGAKWEYAISLPAGYLDPENAERRYPVVFMLHGYGMDPKSFSPAALVADANVANPNVALRPAIYVFPYGRCCYVNAQGQKDCRETNDEGVELDRVPGWARECNSGTFWINRRGYTPTDVTKYGDAFFELMDHIDATYRTLPTADVDAR